MIGKKLYKGQYTNKEYADAAVWCNTHNAHLEDKGEYYEVVENAPYVPTLQEQIVALEAQYGMNRWQREGILAPNSAYSDYAKQKAEEIEMLANELRKANSEDLIENGIDIPETQENAV